MQPDPRAGLCASCTHARVVASARGSAFVLCARSREDPGYAKYPRLPVIRCAGHEPRLPDPGASPRTG